MPEPTRGPSSRQPRRRSRDASPWAARYTFADICGQSPALEHARALARRAAQAACAVLVLGESGTGKELFAQAMHRASPRQAGPFVPVDCAAIPRELLEAELFGYAPGAFSGATTEGKPGKFELAHGGTVFLDEIGEMPLEMQAKLLRVLQERQVVRLGGLALVPVDFTVITATNRDLDAMATRGEFRRDLLYRLDVVRIAIPPLRERPEDIRPLVDDYWARTRRALGKEIRLSEAALRILEQYSWPGNVREVVNVVERLVVSATTLVIHPEDLPPSLLQARADEVSPPPWCTWLWPSPRPNGVRSRRPCGRPRGIVKRPHASLGYRARVSTANSRAMASSHAPARADAAATRWRATCHRVALRTHPASRPHPCRARRALPGETRDLQAPPRGQA